MPWEPRYWTDTKRWWRSPFCISVLGRHLLIRGAFDDIPGYPATKGRVEVTGQARGLLLFYGDMGHDRPEKWQADWDAVCDIWRPILKEVEAEREAREVTQPAGASPG